jgi:hypothetical protein
MQQTTEAKEALSLYLPVLHFVMGEKVERFGCFIQGTTKSGTTQKKKARAHHTRHQPFSPVNLLTDRYSSRGT